MRPDRPTHRPPVGFLPAAGRGLRFGAGAYIKEIFPLLLASEAGQLEPQPICQLALRGIRSAGADRCVVMISPEKAELLRVLGTGEALGLDLGYVIQPEPVGLPDALRRARPWLEGRDVVFAMPDTIVLPEGALGEVHRLRVATGADLVLGVFPVEEPERLGPVEVAEDGAVLRVHDKPGTRAVANSWGVASWSPRFTEFACSWEATQQGGRERVIGHAFEAARLAGLAVRARVFTEGAMLDIGTPAGLRAALRALLERGVLGVPQTG